MAKVRLGENELRVVGCLVEKELATPEYYPLTRNALVAACNQKSNRDPVMALREEDVEEALEGLRALGLAYVSADGGRVPKHAHNLRARWNVDEVQMALLAELMLRGPQTAGELRGRAERMRVEAGLDLGEVEGALEILRGREPPFVEKLPRQPGQKEARYAHLLGDAARPASAAMVPGAPVAAPYAPPSPATENRALSVPAPGPEGERIARLEAEVAALRAEVKALWAELRSLTLQPDPE